MRHRIFHMKILFAISSFTLIFLNSCKKEELKPSNHYIYQKPELKNDGWEVSSLSDVGMDISAIEEIAENVKNGRYKGIHSMLIVKNGFLVFEEYFQNYQDDDLQHIMSITKSISSTLIGIAIDRGFISGVVDSVLTYFPQYTITDPEKKQIKLEHILTLTTGLEWDEKTYPYSDPRNTEYQMVQEEDWMEFVLQRPLRDNPGEVYNYNTGAVHLLSAVIKESSDLFANEFAEQYLFEPLGISEYHWNTDNKGYPCTGATLGGLKMRARDIAKYGFLFLNEGKWHSIQVIPEYWIEESIKPRIMIGQNMQHGYLWRLGQFDVYGKTVDHFYTTGFGGQTLFISPDLDLMIVFLCWENPQDADVQIPILLIHKSILN